MIPKAALGCSGARELLRCLVLHLDLDNKDQMLGSDSECGFRTPPDSSSENKQAAGSPEESRGASRHPPTVHGKELSPKELSGLLLS